MIRPVQTEFARTRLTDEPVHISDADKGLAGGAYICPNSECGWKMEAVKGSQRRHYFRHYRGSPLNAAACNESRLHYDAKHVIARFINQGGTLTVHYPCGCGAEHDAQLGPYDSASVERRVRWQDMTRTPDVAAFGNAGPAAYVEVEVEHPPDYDIDDDRIDAPVVIARIEDQDHLDALKSGKIVKGEHHSGPCTVAQGPQIPTALKEKWQKERDLPYKKQAWSDLERMRNPCDSPVPLNPWRVDSFARDGVPKQRYLRDSTLRDLHRRARILLQRGFTQHPTKPGLFSFETPQVILYADLRSTDVLDIWEVPEPALYAFPCRGVARTTENGLYATALIQYAYYLLEQTLAGARTHFYDGWKVNHDGDSYQPLASRWQDLGDYE